MNNFMGGHSLLRMVFLAWTAGHEARYVTSAQIPSDVCEANERQQLNQLCNESTPGCWDEP